jgi:hypothetical protein
MMSVSLASTGLGGILLPIVVGFGVGALGAWALTPMLIGTALLVCALARMEPSPAVTGA